MIADIEELKVLPEFSELTDEMLIRKIKAVEQSVRSYTHNNFQVRSCRIIAPVLGDQVQGRLKHVREGDSVQISESVNNGVYTVVKIEEGTMTLDGSLYDEPYNLITKVAYPVDVRAGAINMLIYDQTVRKKTGIKSESLSRHSVTYFDMDGENTSIGYPKALVGFLKPYMKARI